MADRRRFLQQSLALGAGGLFAGCASSPSSPPSAAPTQEKNLALKSEVSLAPQHAKPAAGGVAAPPPDIFDAATLDIDFWVKPRTISVYRSATGEKAELLYWKDGEVRDGAYQQLCHLLRDVQGGGVVKQMDPHLLELLWATQAFVARFGMTAPLEILSGYRTPESNQHLIEQGVPAARKSLHMDGKAADIRIANLDSQVLGELIRSFRQGGVGFYYRQTKQGGWIHADTGLQRTWAG
ncbi:MAG: YcbK family protein [Burkholderiaceae bacterium]|nr:YcbK family protein [Burkholderiaceae bacterium]